MNTRFFADGNLKVAYQVAGKGEPLVLLHSGTGSGMSDFALYYDTLCGIFTVISYDRPGYGESTAVDELEPGYLDMETERLSRLLDYLQVEKAHLWGWSDGMTIALKFAIRYPKQTLRIVAMSGHYQRHKSQAAEIYLRKMIARYPRFEPFGKVCQQVSQLPGELFDNQVQKIESPVLFIHGSNDPYTPVSEIEELASLVEGSKLIVCPDTGHAPHLKSPNRENLFRQILNFFSATDQSDSL